MSIAETLETAWREWLRAGRRSGAFTRTYLWASGRRDCLRRMALDLIHPEDQEEFTDDALARFKRGEEREQAVVASLFQIGPRSIPSFQVVGGQERFEIKDRDGTILITGKVDGRLQFSDRKAIPVFEVKSGQTVANVDSLEDLDRSHWTRHHLDQLLSYLLAKSEADGIFIIDRPGMPKFLDVHLEDHLHRAESFLTEARIAIDAKNGGPLPDFHQDLSVCKFCPHLGKSCAPPLDYGAGLRIITDERLVQAAEVIAADQESSKRFDRADKALKEALRGIPQAIVGPLVVRGKAIAKTSYDIPEEIKQQYAQRDPEGSWKITMEKHGITD
jgi:hypothetical protein